MANIYGTKQYENYLKEYEEFIRDKAKDKYEWKLNDTRVKEYKEYKAQLEEYQQPYLFDNCYILILQSNLKITKNGNQIYFCDKMYDDCNLLYFYNYDGQDYLLFRKNLYGYALLNLKTLEEYNYFPDAVLRKEESFIITNGHIFKDILIFEGCFWAGPYTCYLLDLKTFKTFAFFKVKDAWIELYNSENCVQVKDNSAIILFCDENDNSIPVEYTYEGLKKLLEKSQNYDLD